MIFLFSINTSKTP